MKTQKINRHLSLQEELAREIEADIKAEQEENYYNDEVSSVLYNEYIVGALY